MSFEGLCGWVHRDSSGGGVGEGTCVAVGTGSGGADVAAESHLAAVIGKSSGGTNLSWRSKHQLTKAWPCKSARSHTMNRKFVFATSAIHVGVVSVIDISLFPMFILNPLQCPLDITTLDIATALPIATSTPVTNLCHYIKSNLVYNNLRIQPLCSK